VIKLYKFSFPSAEEKTITSQDSMETVTNAKKEMKEANEEAEVKTGENLADEMEKIKMASSTEKTNFILTKELQVESEAQKNPVHLSEVDEDVKKLQSILAEENYKTERLLGRMFSSFQGRRVINSSRQTVSTATQTSWDIPDNNIDSIKLAEAADKIRKLEDALYEKRKCVTKLRNKITHYNLRKERHTRAKENTLPDLKEKSNAQGQAETGGGLNDAHITNAQIEADTGFNTQDTEQCVLHALLADQMLNTEADLNNQKHPQLQDEQQSMDSNCIAQANKTENTGTSTQVKSPVQKQTAKTAKTTKTATPIPKNNTKNCVIAKDKLCAEVSLILAQLTKNSFSDCMSEILELQLDGTNIAAVAYLVHEKATNSKDSSQVLANLCEAMSSNLPKKTGAKMRTIIMERCLSTFPSEHADSDSPEATDAENEMWMTTSEDPLKQREKCINSARFIGELWSAGITKTDAIHKFIVKLLNNADDSSMEYFCALLHAAGDKFEESNNNVSQYFSTVEEMCKSSNDLSSGIKQNLQDLIQFRQEKCMQVKHRPKSVHKRKQKHRK
jgi:hypothetical protein